MNLCLKKCFKALRQISTWFLAFSWCALSGLAIGDAEPSSSAHRARQFALAELKSLAKRAPAAVVATEGLGKLEIWVASCPVPEGMPGCSTHKLNV